jgi:hypothetical protein
VNNAAEQSWTGPLGLPDFSVRREGETTVLRRQSVRVAPWIHLTAQLLALVAVGTSGDVSTTALVLVIACTVLMVVGPFHVMDHVLRQRTEHRRVLRGLSVGRDLVIDGAIVNAEAARDVALLDLMPFGAWGISELTEHQLLNRRKPRRVFMPTMPRRAQHLPTAVRIALTLVVGDRLYELDTFDDPAEALAQARRLKHALGLPKPWELRAFEVLPFSTRTRLVKPFLWLLAELLACLALVVASAKHAAAPLGSLGTVALYLAVHDLLCLVFAAWMWRDARDTGRAISAAVRLHTPLHHGRIGAQLSAERRSP